MFARGVSAVSDTSKEKKLLKTMKFAKELLDMKVDLGKVNWTVMRVWVAQRLTELLGLEDEVLIGYVLEQLEGQKVSDPRVLQINLTGFLEKNTSLFVKELWTLLASASSNPSGIPQKILDEKAEEMRQKKVMEEEINHKLAEERKRRDAESKEAEAQRDKERAARRASDDRERRERRQRDEERRKVEREREAVRARERERRDAERDEKRKRPRRDERDRGRSDHDRSDRERHRSDRGREGLPSPRPQADPDSDAGKAGGAGKGTAPMGTDGAAVAAGAEPLDEQARLRQRALDVLKQGGALRKAGEDAAAPGAGAEAAAACAPDLADGAPAAADAGGAGLSEAAPMAVVDEVAGAAQSKGGDGAHGKDKKQKKDKSKKEKKDAKRAKRVHKHRSDAPGDDLEMPDVP